MRYAFIFLLALGLISSCKKEESPTPTPTPTPDTPTVYVPIFLPGDTSMGACYAKKLTANWKAEALCVVQSHFDTNYIAIGFFTYNSKEEMRESFWFGLIPRFGGEKTYGLKKVVGNTVNEGFVSPSYGTLTSDGDVLEDYYLLDTTATDNHFTVTKMDLANKRMECTFSVTFNIHEPRENPANPKTVKFSNGRAWAVIQD